MKKIATALAAVLCLAVATPAVLACPQHEDKATNDKAESTEPQTAEKDKAKKDTAKAKKDTAKKDGVAPKDDGKVSRK